MKTKKTIAFLCVVVLFMTIFSGCGDNNMSGNNQQNGTHSVTDMAGNIVNVPNIISKYVVLWVGAVDIAIMLDCGEHMIGCSDTAASYSYFKASCKNYENLVLFNKDSITVEGVLDTHPDVVFYRGADNADIAEKLSDAGVCAIDVEFNNYDDLFKATKLMAEVLGSDEAQEKCTSYCNYAAETIERASLITKSVMDKKSVLVIRDTSSLRAYGMNRFAGRWVTLCGGNYSLTEGDPDGYVNLTKEQLMEYDPDILVFVIPGEADKFLGDSQWNALTAVKNKCVYENPSVIGTWSNHGTECVLQFWWAIGIMYPELVDYNLSTIVKSFYHDFYNMDLNDEDIVEIIQK